MWRSTCPIVRRTHTAPRCYLRQFASEAREGQGVTEDVFSNQSAAARREALIVQYYHWLDDARKLPLAKRARAQNIAMLCADFDAFLAEYAQAETVFGNVSDHFYHRALGPATRSRVEVLGSDALFADYSYAALATWMVGRTRSVRPLP